MPAAKNIRQHNRHDWKRLEWVDEMVEAIKDEPFFRWFDSGDCYSYRLAIKIGEVVKRTPETMHWLPTRMHKFPKFRKLFEFLMASLPNLTIRYSSDGIHGELTDGDCISTIVESASDAVASSALRPITVCYAYERDGKCGDCRACWDREFEVIAYPQHGRAMRKVNIQLKSA